MIKHYSSQRALVFYFSDHGDMIDEPQQRGFFGHGTNVDHPTVDIPFFVYASPQLRKEHPRNLGAYQEGAVSSHLHGLVHQLPHKLTRYSH